MMLSGGDPATVVQRGQMYAEHIKGSIGTFSGRGTFLDSFTKEINFESLRIEELSSGNAEGALERARESGA